MPNVTMPTANYAHKSVPVFIKQADEASGIIEAIVSVMGIIDLGKDVIYSGAYTKTISERAGKILPLDNHNYGSVMSVFGVILDMREVGRDELPIEVKSQYPSATGGLYVKIQAMMDDPVGLGIFKRVKVGAISEWSIGYDAVKTNPGKVLDPETGKNIVVREIHEIRLYDISTVLWGMNQATSVVGVKAATPMQDLPIADRERAWDAGAANKRVQDWAGGPDNIDFGKIKKAYFWYDSEDSEKMGSYKLPYADVIDGTLTAIPRGIFAVAQRLDGTDIPAGDKDKIKSNVSKWYKRMADKFDDDTLVAPWDKEKTMPRKSEADAPDYAPVADENQHNRCRTCIFYQQTDEASGYCNRYDFQANGDYLCDAYQVGNEKRQRKEYDGTQAQMRLGDHVKSSTYDMYMSKCNDLYRKGFVDGAEHRAMCNTGMKLLDAMDAGIPDDVGLRPYQEFGMFFMFGDSGADEAKKKFIARLRKAGRVLSSANADKIQNAFDLLEQVLMDAGLIEVDEGEGTGLEGEAEPSKATLTLQDIQAKRQELAGYLQGSEK